MYYILYIGVYYYYDGSNDRRLVEFTKQLTKYRNK